MFLIYLFCVVEAIDIGLHGVVDRGIELAEERHEAMAELVAACVEGGVGDVFDIRQAVVKDIRVDVGTGERQQRADNPQIETIDSEFRNRAYAVETGDARSTEEVEEEGLDGVVAVVRRGDGGETVLAAEVGEEGVAEFACRLLDALAVGFGIGPRVEIGGEERDTQGSGSVANKALVAVAVARTEMEVAMGYRKGDSGTPTKMQHRHRVAAATDGKQHLIPERKEVLLFDIVAKTL